MAKFIVTQDRDKVHRLNDGEYLYTTAIIHSDTIMGINLMMSDGLLGTFDSIEEAAEEINRIFDSNDEIIFVGGYSQGGFAEW